MTITIERGTQTTAAESEFAGTVSPRHYRVDEALAAQTSEALETVVASEDMTRATGLFFDAQTPEAVVDAVQRFERVPVPFSAEVCRAHAEKFSDARFRQEFGAYVQACWDKFDQERKMA